MYTKIIEATNNFMNWGKFLLGKFSWEEWNISSKMPGCEHYNFLLKDLGWTEKHIWVLDLQTGEGAYFLPAKNACAKADLDKHKIWVCPMFEPFLEWLYQQDNLDFDVLPDWINLKEIEFSFCGYRRGEVILGV
jgi:hypothetical protein